MALSKDRRTAFARAFVIYPQIIEELVENNIVLKSIAANIANERKYSNLFEKQGMMQVFMAQFFTRIIQTRCAESSIALQRFANSTVIRYHEFSRQKLGTLEMYSEPKYRSAVQAFEQNMSSTIFAALATEAKTVQDAGERLDPLSDADLQILKDWDEADFWEDVFMSFSFNSRPHWPSWAEPAYAIFVDSKHAFSKALDD